MENLDQEEEKTLPPGFQPDFDLEFSDDEERQEIFSENNKANSVHRPPPPNPYPKYISVPVNSMHEDFIRQVFSLIMNEGIFFNEHDTKKQSPFEYCPPEELSSLIDFELKETGTEHAELLELIKNIIKYSPHQGHPYYMEQHAAGVDPYGIMADIVSTAFNNNPVIYLVSPSYTMMEMEVLRRVSILAGYLPENAEAHEVEGVITPGGALANSYAFSVAVRESVPGIKDDGLFGAQRPIVFVSQASLYTYCKGAIFQGLGLQSVVAVRCNNKGQMVISDLRFRIQESRAKGHIPLMVVATAGTPILRAFDPIDEIADIALEFGLWLHVDGTWGGACLLSQTHKSKLKGIERSDSFAWSQHFILSAPFTSAVLILQPKHKGCLLYALGLKEETAYAFLDTPLYEEKYDTGNRHIQTSRRPEIFKFWLMWKAKGMHGLGQHIDYIFENAQFCTEEIKRRKNTFSLVLDEFEGTNVSFVYTPPTLRGLNRRSNDFKDNMNKVAPTLQQLLLKDGIMNICCHKLPHTTNFLTLSLHNSAVTKEDIVYLLNQIENYGQSCARLSWKWSSEGLYQ